MDLKALRGFLSFCTLMLHLLSDSIVLHTFLAAFVILLLSVMIAQHHTTV